MLAVRDGADKCAFSRLSCTEQAYGPCFRESLDDRWPDVSFDERCGHSGLQGIVFIGQMGN